MNSKPQKSSHSSALPAILQAGTENHSEHQSILIETLQSEIWYLKEQITTLKRTVNSIHQQASTGDRLARQEEAIEIPQGHEVQQMSKTIRDMAAKINELETKVNLKQQQTPDDVRQQVQQIIDMIASQQKQHQDMSEEIDVLKDVISCQQQQIRDLEADSAERDIQYPKSQAIKAEIDQLKAAQQNQEEATKNSLKKLESSVSSQQDVLKSQVYTRGVEFYKLQAAQKNQEKALEKALNKLEDNVFSQQAVLIAKVEELKAEAPAERSPKEDASLISRRPDNCSQIELNKRLSFLSYGLEVDAVSEAEKYLQLEKSKAMVPVEFKPSRITQVKYDPKADLLINNPMTKNKSIERKIYRNLEEGRKRLEEKEIRRKQAIRLNEQQQADTQRRLEVRRGLFALGAAAVVLVSVVNPTAGLVFTSVAKKLVAR